MPIYVCRDWLINTDERRIVKDGEYLDLTPKSFDVIQLLIERRGSVVTKDDILGIVWHGSFVEEGNLPVHISKIRRTLGETKQSPLIETIPGTGYRFIAPAKDASEEDWESQVNLKQAISPNSPNDLGVLIAVLPFENIDGDRELEYLAEGLSEGLLYSLSRNDRIRVIARNTSFRYKHTTLLLKEVGETLGVEYLVTGRLRPIKDGLQLSAEITRVSDGTQMWGQVFERKHDELAVLQEQLLQITLRSIPILTQSMRNLNTHLPAGPNNESTRLLLKARHLMQRRDKLQLTNAVGLLERSIALDPSYSPTYAVAVECQLMVYIAGYENRTATINRLAPLLNELRNTRTYDDASLSALAAASMFCDLDFKNAQGYLWEALRLNPNSLIANRRLADVLITLGRFSEAQERLDRMLAIDPISFPTYTFVGRCYYRMNRFDIALTFLDDALELEPGDFGATTLYAACLIERGETALAMSYLRSSFDSHPHPDTEYMMAYCSAVSGDSTSAKHQLESLTSSYSEQCAIYVARVHAALGDLDAAFYYLEEAYSIRDIELRGILSDPRWKHLCRDRRFIEFAARLGITN